MFTMPEHGAKHQPRPFVALQWNYHTLDGAGDRNRTRNPLLTKQVLCQLSYTGFLSEG
jgi:hypothetical protein